jgi:phosphate transport system protein
MSAGLFIKELDKVKGYLIEMADDVLRMLEESCQAIASMDHEKAKAVIKFDKQVNDLENRVVNKAIDLIALNQPVAGDLRFLAASLRLSTELERIGDLAANLSKRVVDMHHLKHAGKKINPLPKNLDNMTAKVLHMLGISIASFKNNDHEDAARVMDMDDEVDEYYRRIRKEIMGIIEEDGKVAAWGFEVILLATHLERLADHATNLSEETIYMAKGRNVRHQVPKDREEV